MLRLDLNKDKHCSSMFDKLEGMRRDKKHCDFIIKAGSDAIDTHRNLLVAGSDYFDAMLSHDTKENRSGVVEMVDADAECVKICISYIYGGKVEISVNKCEQLMYAATLMQLQNICDGIADWMRENLNTKSYFVTRQIANMFGCEKLREACKTFAECNFLSISKETEFGGLDKSYIMEMLKSKKVKMLEEEKLNALLSWIKRDDKREKFLGEMLECVELDRVPVECHHHLLKNEPLIHGKFEHFKLFSFSLINAGRIGMRHLDNNAMDIVIFDQISSHLQCFNPRTNTWKQMQRMHDAMTELHFSAVSFKDHIYALMADKSVYRLEYSNEAATWERMADMIEEHGLCPPATVVAGQIYVIGGSYGGFTKTAETYDPVTNQWCKIVDRPQPSQCSELLAIRGNIYSFGGIINDNRVSKKEKEKKWGSIVRRFDSSTSSWTNMKPMKDPKCYVAAVELDGRAYVLGGDNGLAHLRSVDRYDPDIDEWTSLCYMITARSWLRAFTMDGMIYAVGGYNSSPSSIERYSPDQDEWEMVLIPSGIELKILESVSVILE